MTEMQMYIILKRNILIINILNKIIFDANKNWIEI